MNRYKSSLGVAVGVLAIALFVAPSASAAAPDASTGGQLVVPAAAPGGVDAAAPGGQVGSEPGTVDPGTADAPAVVEPAPVVEPQLVVEPDTEEAEPAVGSEPAVEPGTTLAAPDDAAGADSEAVDPAAAEAVAPGGAEVEPAPVASEDGVTGEPLVRVLPRTEPRWGVDGGLLSGTTASGSGLCSYTGSHPTLSLGSSGAAVKHMQCLLRYYHGYSIVTDGYFGSVTRSIVMKFQAHKGLVADGVVGPVTWNALHPY